MRACCSQCHLNTPSTPFLSFISLLSTMCLVQHVTMGRCVVKSIPSLHFIFSDPSDFQGNFREWLSRCAIYCSFTAQEPTSKLTTDVLSGQMWRGGPPTSVLARSSEQPNVFLRSERPYTTKKGVSVFSPFRFWSSMGMWLQARCAQLPAQLDIPVAPIHFPTANTPILST